MWDNRMFGTDRNKPLTVQALDAGAGVMLPYYVEDNGVLLLYAKGENTIRIYEIEGLSMTHDFAELGKQKREGKKFEVHKCTEYKCVGEPTAGLAFLPRRAVDYKNAEWLRCVRLTPSIVESVSFSVPRSQEIQGYFYDDLYPPARSSEPVLTNPKAWLTGSEKAPDGPKRIDLNTEGLKILSQRPAAESHQAIKRGIASTDRMKREQEEQERRKREQQEALDRMQRLAVQHEKYNPNLSKPGQGHDKAVAGDHAVNVGPSEVNEEEWGD
jgi:coronin-7